MIKFTSGVNVPATCIIAAAAINAAIQISLTKDLFVTSGNDKVHARGSAHYTDEALDFRSKHLTTAEKQAFIVTVKRRLGQTFTVLLEDDGRDNEHIHIQVAKDRRKNDD